MILNPTDTVYCISCKQAVDPVFQHCPFCGADQRPPVRQPAPPFEGNVKASVQVMWMLLGLALVLVVAVALQAGNAAFIAVPTAMFWDVPSLALAVYLFNGRNEKAAVHAKARLVVGATLWIVAIILWVRFTSSIQNPFPLWKSPTS